MLYRIKDAEMIILQEGVCKLSVDVWFQKWFDCSGKYMQHWYRGWTTTDCEVCEKFLEQFPEFKGKTCVRIQLGNFRDFAEFLDWWISGKYKKHSKEVELAQKMHRFVIDYITKFRN